MNRERGYYFVKHEDETDWWIGEWCDNFWILTGDPTRYPDHYFEKIDERPITRKL